MLFPEYLNWHQHSFAAWMSQKRDVSSLNAFLMSIYDATIYHKCLTTLLSGEDFENFLIDTHLALEFETLAKSVGYSEIEWIVVQRDPLEYLLSIYSEKSGYKMILDLGTISNVILEYGFFSASSPNYNYKFVFDISKFSEFFKKDVNPNLTVLNFDSFINDFVGKPIFSRLVNDKSLVDIRKYAKNSPIKRKRLDALKIEFRYLANFLGMKPNKEFYEQNNKLVDSLVNHRLEMKKTLLSEVQIKFKKRFY